MSAIPRPAHCRDVPARPQETLPCEPFAAPKYGLAARIPRAWTIAEREKEDRVFVAIVPQPDFGEPGVVACELALAPESLDDYRTRIDKNAKRDGRPERASWRPTGSSRMPRGDAPRDRLGVPSRSPAGSGAR